MFVEVLYPQPQPFILSHGIDKCNDHVSVYLVCKFVCCYLSSNFSKL